MEELFLPPVREWGTICKRPVADKKNLEDNVKNIIEKVRKEKDNALRSFSEKFDGVIIGDLKVSAKELENSAKEVPDDLKKAIDIAKANIEKFHISQLISEPVIEILKGVRCWRKSVAIEKVGLYIPGGSAPLFSTLLMLAIPAKIAGCKNIVVCTPAGRDGKVNPIILYVAKILGLQDIYKAGGAQAIAAMAYGTESVPNVYKIFGPGNQFVTKAKELVQLDGIAIDMPAGPSEVLIIADKNATPEFVAADLLSQAEHGADSQVILVTDDKNMVSEVKEAVKNQIGELRRKDIAIKSLENSKLILFSTIEECIDFSNMYAPEHLIINTIDALSLADMVTNAGSVFLGNFSCESAGDYASGTNHTLPTNGYARNYSGLSVDSFMKKITFQELDRDGIKNIGPAVEIMADAESLDAHSKAMSIRLKSL